MYSIKHKAKAWHLDSQKHVGNLNQSSSEPVQQRATNILNILQNSPLLWKNLALRPHKTRKLLTTSTTEAILIQNTRREQQGNF